MAASREGRVRGYRLERRRLQVHWDRDSGRWFAFVLLACAVVCFNWRSPAGRRDTTAQPSGRDRPSSPYRTSTRAMRPPRVVTWTSPATTPGRSDQA
jgi:hypothetical protein